MPDLHSIEDEAARYVLGELTEAERRAFEAQLDQSDDLRARVRELEEAAVAVALAAPRRRPPAQVWEGIETAIAREKVRKVVIPAWWTRWWRSGWAAATACLLGWLVYALWPDRPGSANVAVVPADFTAHSPQGAGAAGSRENELRHATPTTPSASDDAFALLQARTQELGALHRQVAELGRRLTQMSQTLTQQQALLSESNRLKFFQLGPVAGDGSSGGTAQPLSPRLQWALYVAMARELGWQLPADATAGAATGSGREVEAALSGSSLLSQAGVDFSDLRPASNSVAGSAAPAQDPLELASAAQAFATESVSSNAVPGFASASSAFLAFDSTVAPSGSSLTFWTLTYGGAYLSVGSTVLGNNPMVVAVPASTGSGDGTFTFLTVTATTPGGAVTNVGQVYLPGFTSP